jgi:hypothetical protein
MIELGWLSSVSFLGAIIVASLAGSGIAGFTKWLESETLSGLRLATGLGLGPFLLGLATILMLLVAPGASHRLHFWAAIALLLPLAFMGLRLALADMRTISNSVRHDPIAVAPALIVSAFLLFIAAFTPLTQNDALEYAIIVDRMFELRSLASYPMMHPELEPSGFYAPWTHPPLFPALLYFAKLNNPIAQMPALERLIGPWALLLCGLMSASLARLSGFKSGGLAFVAVVTAPLALLGAANGLVDALAMLGFAIPMCLVAAGARSGGRLAVLSGLALGAGAWAHSQGILLYPLVIAALLIRDRILTGRMNFKGVSTTIAASLAVGALPFVWNVLEFGVPVSDDQALSATLHQGWAGYFALDRGLSSWPSQVSYGLFKMVTAPEAFGAVFLLAAVTAFAVLRSPANESAVSGTRLKSKADRLVSAMPVLFIGLYLLGVLVSLLLGQITLIKNERYFLVVLPAAAVLAAGLPQVVERWVAGRARGSAAVLLSAVVHPALVVLFVAQASFLTAYALNRNLILTTGPGQPFEQTLRGRGEFAHSYFLRDRTPADSIVLSLKPADMFYAKRRMLSQFDPRLAAFYATADTKAALTELRKLGINFIHLPSYAMPTYYNSVLKDIVTDSSQSTLRFENNDGQIFELLPTKGKIVATKNVSVGQWPWEVAQGVVFGSRKRIGLRTGGYTPLTGSEFIRSSFASRTLPRHFSAIFRMGKDGEPIFADISPGDEVTARFLLSGKCHIMIQASERPEPGKDQGEPRMIATVIIEPRTSPVDIPVRFRSNSSGIALRLIASGDCNLVAKNIELFIFSIDKSINP